MTDTEKIAALTELLDNHFNAVEDEDGDKFISDPNLAIDAIDAIVGSGDLAKARRDGFVK